MSVWSKTFLTLVTILLRLIPTKGWKLILLKDRQELKVKVNYIPVTTQTREPLMDNRTIATYTINDGRKEAAYAITNSLLL